MEQVCATCEYWAGRSYRYPHKLKRPCRCLHDIENYSPRLCDYKIKWTYWDDWCALYTLQQGN